jgi:hypothetical protein
MPEVETSISRETFDRARREIGATSVLPERAGRNWHKLSPENRQVVLEAATVLGYRILSQRAASTMAVALMLTRRLDVKPHEAALKRQIAATVAA